MQKAGTQSVMTPATEEMQPDGDTSANRFTQPLTRAGELLAEARALADGLREAADCLSVGQPPSDRDLAVAVIAWTDAATVLLGDAYESLPALIQALEEKRPSSRQIWPGWQRSGRRQTQSRRPRSPDAKN